MTYLAPSNVIKFLIGRDRFVNKESDVSLGEQVTIFSVFYSIKCLIKEPADSVQMKRS